MSVGSNANNTLSYARYRRHAATIRNGGRDRRLTGAIRVRDDCYTYRLFRLNAVQVITLRNNTRTRAD
jgi:hypothetical protein